MSGGDSASARERFENWRDLLGRTRVCDATTSHVDTFTAQARRFELGPVVLLGTSFPSARLRRTERMIRSSDEEIYHLTLLTAGHHALQRADDQRETYGVGDFSLIDSSHPYDGRFTATDDAHVRGVGIDLPASLLPVPPHRLRELLGRRLSGREGTGALLADFLLSLDRQAATLGPAEAARLGTIVADLTAVWIARELDAVNTLPQESRQQALVESIRAFIRHHLHDPDLTPATIAAAHHISVSYLHRLFTRHSDGRTVAAFVRDQRLKKAHRDLADPALRALPVQAVAARCGIPRASDFGRAFKAAYGLSPREYRNARAAGTPSEGVPAVPGSGPGQDVVTPPVLSEEFTLVQ